MNFLQSLSSAVISASTAALAGVGSIPGLPNYILKEKSNEFEGKTIWSLYDGLKKDDNTVVSVFVFDVAQPSTNYSSSNDRRALLPLAKNALRKFRTLRHPNILRLIDGTETDTIVYIITEHVTSLTVTLQNRNGEKETGINSEESKIYGLLHLSTALSFLNKDGNTIHGNLRIESIFITQSGDWKLGGMEICTKREEETGVIWSQGGLLPDSRSYVSPEVRKGGYAILKEIESSCFDSYQLHLLVFNLFNGPLPNSFSLSSDAAPALPNARGSIPQSLFAAWRRLGNPNHRPRLKSDVFLELGNGSVASGGGWWPTNRLVKLSLALEGFSLATESERYAIIATLKEMMDGSHKAGGLPDNFLKYKILPSLVRGFEFGGGGPGLLPLILGLGVNLSEKEYAIVIIQPLIRMFATPDRAIRMALLTGLEKFADKLTNKDVQEKVWPHLMTGFGDVVPVIREATVKSILLIAPKLSDRILNNDLLRHLAKTQTDPEPGIRTNTCILLGRLSQFLQPSTNRKVLVPAFARALRDPFVHARIAGLMALMATADCYEKEDLAGKVIPAMSICLVDKEKAVRDQGYRAIDMFVKKCEALTANMPVTVQVESDSGPQSQAAAQTQPGLATNAAGAAGALAGWAFTSLATKLSAAELEAPIDPQQNGLSTNGNHSRPQAPSIPTLTRPQPTSSLSSGTRSPALSIQSGFDEEEETNDWGGDLMDVNNDEGDWDAFVSGEPSAPKIDPLAARLSSKPKKSLKLGGVRSSTLRVPLDLDAGDNWDIEEPSTVPPLQRSSIVNKPTIQFTAPTPISKPIFKPISKTLSASSSFSSTSRPIPVLATKPTSKPKVVAKAEDDWGNFDEAEEKKSSVSTNGGGGEVSKEDKLAKMALMREERKKRLAKAKLEGK